MADISGGMDAVTSNLLDNFCRASREFIREHIEKEQHQKTTLVCKMIYGCSVYQLLRDFIQNGKELTVLPENWDLNMKM